MLQAAPDDDDDDDKQNSILTEEVTMQMSAEPQGATGSSRI